VRSLAALALLALPAAAEEEGRDTATVGALHAEGYVVGPLFTQPATDSAINRFGFVMKHPDGAAHPLYACRLMIGSGDPDALEPMVMTNACERID
jgi:hypothetical protein